MADDAEKAARIRKLVAARESATADGRVVIDKQLAALGWEPPVRKLALPSTEKPERRPPQGRTSKPSQSA